MRTCVKCACALTCSSGLCRRWSASHPAWPGAATISHNPPGPRSSSADLCTTFKQKKKIKSSACFTSVFRMLTAAGAPPVGMRMLMSDSVDRLLPQVKYPLLTWTQPNKSVCFFPEVRACRGAALTPQNDLKKKLRINSVLPSECELPGRASDHHSTD